MSRPLSTSHFRRLSSLLEVTVGRARELLPGTVPRYGLLFRCQLLFPINYRFSFSYPSAVIYRPAVTCRSAVNDRSAVKYRRAVRLKARGLEVCLGREARGLRLVGLVPVGKPKLVHGNRFRSGCSSHPAWLHAHAPSRRSRTRHIGTWLPEGGSSYARLTLFVDEIDRRREERHRNYRDGRWISLQAPCTA